MIVSPGFAPPAVMAEMLGIYRYANATIPAGNTVTTTTETPFASKASLPAGILTPGALLRVVLFGRYTSVGLTPTVTPRVRLGGVELFPTRAIMGLLNSTNVSWHGRAEFVVTEAGIVGTGLLLIDDNQVRSFGGAPATGINLAQALDVTASAQWGQASCSITMQGLVVEVLRSLTG